MPFCGHSQTFEPNFFLSRQGSISYQCLMPKGFKEDQKYPMVLFLHGAGERGSDNQKQLVHGSDLFLQKSTQDKYPAMVIFPQCPKDIYWANVERIENASGDRQFNFGVSENPTSSMKMLLSLVDSLVQLSFVDQKRIYVMGLSMGGMGTFEIVSRRPDLFAAAIPICGGGDVKQVNKYASTTDFWIFHGAKDQVVLPKYSEEMVRALQHAGATSRFTLYEDANHNSWDPAFDESELLNWLFAQQKSN
ncbi:MAG: prolyl oligopeptidase family serine peptidase [Bacteroidota bacterium]